MLSPVPENVLSVETGQFSSAGHKAENQDFHGVMIPNGAALTHKGIAGVLCDGISTSRHGRTAAETAVRNFLTDYYCTSETWTVATSAGRVIRAVNSWLHSQSRTAPTREQGHVCTFAALILKGRSGYLFHAGDSRICRLDGKSLECLTGDHRIELGAGKSYLGRALGLEQVAEFDHQQVDLCEGDVFVMTTDGVHDFLPPAAIAAIINGTPDPGQAAAKAVDAALAAGSDDNLTIQILRVKGLPDQESLDVLADPITLQPAALPQVPGVYEGYRILRELHANSRSHIFLAEDQNGQAVALKFPSMDLREDDDYLRRMALEEWAARRMSSPHVVQAMPPARPRKSLFLAFEYLEGQTLRQWMADNPNPGLEAVRGIVEQIVRGMRAFHRKEMIHQDLRPENIFLDTHGTVKLIDFGSVRIAGVLEAAPLSDKGDILGTHQYSAPEFFLGYAGTALSDQFSLGVIVYEMLTGRLPYGSAVARATTHKSQSKLKYRSAAHISERIPEWVDAAIAKSVHPVPGKRHEALSAFLEDLRRPNPVTAGRGFIPFSERDPVRFWQFVSAAFALLSLVLFTQSFQ